MAKRHFVIEIVGDIDTIALWRLIDKFKVNLTAVDNMTWIYGDIELHNLGTIVERCALFGALKVTIDKGGGDNEQKREEG